MARNPVTTQSFDPGLHCSVEDQRRLLGDAPYFRSLDAAQIHHVQQQFVQRHYLVDTTIHYAGEAATRLSIVAAGSVKLVRTTIDGKDVVIDLLTAGDQFGSLAELGDATYRETAIAHTECCILSTTAPVFSELMRTYPSIALDTLAIVAGRLSDARSTIEQLSAHPVEQRVVQLLLHLASKIGVERDGGTLIDLPLSRQDIADMTGTTVESASRVMSELRKSGDISSGRRWISIANEAALRDRVS